MSVPSGITPGTYNMFATTSSGTNLISDVKFTVSAPAASADTAITDVTPDPVILTASTSQTVSISVSDNNSGTVYYHVTSLGGSWNADTGSIAMSSSEGTATPQFTASTVAGPFYNTVKVDDTNSLPGTFDNSQTLLIYVQPSF